MLIIDGSPIDPFGPSGDPPWISLGDFTIVQKMVDEHGVRWEINELDGWFSPAGASGSTEQRSADHGGWPSPGYYEPRQIQFTGSVHTRSWRSARAALDRFFAALPVSSLTPLVVSIDGEATQAMVRQAEKPELDAHNYIKRAYFTVTLEAPDPRRYSLETVTVETGLPQTTGGLLVPLSAPLTINAVTTSGVLAVENEGNMGTRPILTAHGPLQPFAITHRGTGQTLRYHEVLPAGRRLVIDTGRRRALLDGTVGRRVTGSWFEYARGLNEVAFSSATYNPDARLVSEHRHASR